MEESVFTEVPGNSDRANRVDVTAENGTGYRADMTSLAFHGEGMLLHSTSITTYILRNITFDSAYKPTGKPSGSLRRTSRRYRVIYYE